MRRKHVVLLLVMAIAFHSCNDSAVSKEQSESQAVKVRVMELDQEQSKPVLSVSGKIEAVQSANLSTRMMGHVRKIHANVGDQVKKGQLIISINNVDLSAKLAQVNAGIAEAKVAFMNAEKDYDRYSSLFKDRSATQKELDDITAQYEMAKARLESAEQMKNEVLAQFSYANIRSPFDGVVTNKFINVGDLASPGMPLMQVETQSGFQVIARVPETEISDVPMDVQVEVFIKSLDTLVTGKVIEVSTSARNTGGQYLVKITLDDTEAKVLSGMFATVLIPVDKPITGTVIFIPESAIIERGQLTGVFTVSQSNTALLRWLRLGRKMGENVEVLSGLSSGETLIISSEEKLYNGAKLNITEL